MTSTDTKPKSRAEREEEEKARRRAENATIVTGLRQALDTDEQLLGFARGRLAGGIRGKLSLGPEAFFAPFVNIGLTERRLVIQHINVETGRPGEIFPHYYALGDIAALSFSDIETFGGEVAARLTMRLRNDQHTRLRLRGQNNFENAQAIIKVFQSLTLAPRASTTPTQRVCPACQHILDQPFKFCPYCGQMQDLSAPTPAAPPAAAEPERTYPPTPPGPTEPEFLDTVPYQDAPAYQSPIGLGGPTVDDGLDFLDAIPSARPVAAPEPAPTPVAEPAVTPEPEPEPTSTPEPPAAAEAEPGAAAAPVAEAAVVAPEDANLAEAPAAIEESAFETPSAFEGWSVDPGASPAVVEPTAEVDLPAPVAEAEPAASPSTPEHVAVETEVIGLNPVEEIARADSDPPAPTVAQTDVSSSPEEPTPTVHPEAEFAPIPTPEPSAVASEGAEAAAAGSVLEEDLTASAAPEEAPAAVRFDAPLAEADPAPQPEPLLEPSAVANPDGIWTPPAFETSAEPAPVSLTEFEAPPAVESFAMPAPEPEPVAEPTAAPAHESAGFVTEPVAVETPTTVSQDFEPFAPVVAPAAASEESAAAEPAPAAAEPTPAPEAAPVAAAVPPPTAETAEATPEPAPSTSEDRFAALLREIRGGDAPAAAPVEPPAVRERRDGPMSVAVHIMRPPISVNETFTGRNAEEVVGKLKARVLPELNFAMRLMVNSFSNLRFAQEIVRRYNEQEKTNYPIPNSCWEFLLNAEEINYVTIQLQG